MRLQARRQLGRQHGDPVLETLAVAHQDFATRKLDILDPQAQTFHQAQAGAIKQAGNQPMGTLQSLKQRPHLGPGQHHGQALGRAGLRHVIEPRQRDLKHFPVKKQKRTLGLILRRCRDIAGHRQMGEKRLHLDRPHVFWMLLAKMANKSFNPVKIGLLGTETVVLDPDFSPHLVEQARRR